MKQTTEDYYEGKGCKCYARSQGECSCNVDWTPKEVYRLRDEIEAKDKRIAELESALMAIKYNSIFGKEYYEINSETLESCLIILNK